MKRVIKDTLLIGLFIAISSTLTYYYGKRVQRFADKVQHLQEEENKHYLLRSLQLTANDLPVYFVDQIPGMGGTKEKPELCGAYYDPKMQSIVLISKNK